MESQSRSPFSSEYCVAFIAQATSNYAMQDDPLVRIKLGDEMFSVSRSRLVMRCRQFETMFSLTSSNSQEHVAGADALAAVERGTDGTDVGPYDDVKSKISPEARIVELHNDPDEFKAFLWYLNADPIAAEQFRCTPTSTGKCMHLLGIASVAHMYEAEDTAEWSMDNALTMLATGNAPLTVDAALAERLLRTAARWGENSKVLWCARDVVCSAMHPNISGPLSADIVSAVRVAHAVGDQYVLAHAHYYTLRYGKGNWKKDKRLLPIDRRSILAGAHALNEVVQGRRAVGRTGRAIKTNPASDMQDLFPQPRTWESFNPHVADEIRPYREVLCKLFNSAPWNLDG